MRKTLILLLTTTLSFPSFAQTTPCLIPASTEDLLQELTLERDQAPKSIVIGNEDLGYFEAPVSQVQSKRFSFRFLPVTYQKPILFFLRDQNGNFEKILQKQFVSPFTCLQHSIKRKGRLTSPFFFTNWIYRSPLGEMTSFPVVMNRLGEIVWANVGFERRAERDWNTYAEEIPGGLRILGQYAQSQVADFLFDGRVAGTHDFLKNSGVNSINHSFALVGPEQIALLRGVVRKVSLWRDYLVDFRNWSEFFKLLLLPRRLFFGNEVVLFNLKTKDSKTLYSSFDVFQTRHDVPLNGEGDPPTDPFIYPKEKKSDADLLREPIFKDFDPAHVDWSHENSIHFDSQRGYLITVRNLNSIVWLDPQGKLKGTFGSSPRSTWKWPTGSVPFSMPHSARFFGDSILLYDNANTTTTSVSAPQSRILIFKPNPNRTSEILFEKEILLEGAKSIDRGSVRAIDSNRILSFVSRAPGHPISFEEYDLSSNELVASLTIDWPFRRRSQEGTPLKSLGFPEIRAPIAPLPKRSTVRRVQIKATTPLDWKKPLEEDVY